MKIRILTYFFIFLAFLATKSEEIIDRKRRIRFKFEKEHKKRNKINDEITADIKKGLCIAKEVWRHKSEIFKLAISECITCSDVAVKCLLRIRRRFLSTKLHRRASGLIITCGIEIARNSMICYSCLNDAGKLGRKILRICS